MPLVDVEVVPYAGPIPDLAERYMEAGRTQIDHFHYQKRSIEIPAFVPSDFDSVYRYLRAIQESYLAPGKRFCEWGAGFGVITALATMLGYEAFGIEIHADLVEQAERLAEHFDVPAQFICGSLVPRGGEEIAGDTVDFAWLTSHADDTYAELGLEPADFDLFFVYPWPGEEQAVYRLFQRFAATGALLISYHGTQGMRVQRKVAGKKRSSRLS